MSNRIVVVDESEATDKESVAIPYSDRGEALEEFRRRVIAAYDRDGFDDEEIRREVEEADDFFDAAEGVLAIEEGTEGVWTGFSSADRALFGDGLPLPDDGFVGNGDPSFFFTAGTPDGTKTKATPSVTSAGDVHPAYAAWLRTHG